MSELIAQGKYPDHRWRRRLPVGQSVTLGRTTASFRVPWDDRVSREHVQLELVKEGLQVEKLAAASNPVFFHGQPCERFSLQAGEHFVIGNTTFTLSQEQAQVTMDVRHPIRQRTFSPEFLRQVHFRDAEQRIDVLNRLPDVISSAGNEQDLLNRLTNTLLAGMPAATTIGIVRSRVPDKRLLGENRGTDRNDLAEISVNADNEPRSLDIEIIQWDRRGPAAGDFQPSEKLIRQAIESSETVLHLWEPTQKNNPEFTLDPENDWAFVCPLDSAATPGWGIYVTGSQRVSATGSTRDSDAEDLQGDIKFCELVGSMLRNLLLVKQLERRQASLRGFFSPIVLDAIVGRDPEEVLAPKEVPMSVLFCDLRGFAKTSEAMSDELFHLLKRVSQTLDVVTGKILSHSGVIGDFHGDSVMGFWGWPLRQDDTAIRAVQTALDIQSEFRKIGEQEDRRNQAGHFKIGIGIATGIAVAGKIGTRDQVKVTAFGPVVNLASRLEGMNRLLNSAVLMDRATRDKIVEVPNTRNLRVRGLGRIQPFGMRAATEVFQILDESESLTAEELAQFQDALTFFQSGQWHQAEELLAGLPDDDAGKQFLQQYLQRTDSRVPEDWNGVIEMTSK